MPPTDTAEPIPATATTTALARLVEHHGLAVESVQLIIDTFRPMFEQATVLLIDAEKITVTDATQVTEIKRARLMRLRLKEVRVSIENTRKVVKDESLRKGKSIDDLAGKLKAMIEPVEARLEEAEKFAERAEAARKARIKQNREDDLRPFGINTSFYQLGEMSEAEFADLLAGTKAAHEKKIAEVCSLRTRCPVSTE